MTQFYSKHFSSWTKSEDITLSDMNQIAMFFFCWLQSTEASGTRSPDRSSSPFLFFSFFVGSKLPKPGYKHKRPRQIFLAFFCFLLLFLVGYTLPKPGSKHKRPRQIFTAPLLYSSGISTSGTPWCQSRKQGFRGSGFRLQRYTPHT